MAGFAQEKESLLKSVQEAEKEGDATAIAQSYYKLGVYYDQHDSILVSNETLRKGLPFARRSGDKKITAQILNYLASSYSEEGTFDSINEMFREASELFLANGDTAKAADVLINLGMEYVNGGLYEKALETKQKALEYRLLCGDSSNISFYFQQIGEVYKELKLNEQWKSYLEKARTLASNEKYARLRTRISILNDIGGIYADEENFSGALDAYEEMIKLSITNNYPKGVATANSNLVEVYFALDDPEKALKAALKSYEMSLDGSAYRQISSLENLASCYKRMGDMKLAYRFYEKALQHPSILDYPDVQLTVLKGIAFTSANLGMNKEAYNFQVIYNELHDSLQNVEVKKNINLLETRFQTREKEQQIQLLRTQNELQKAQITRIGILTGIGIVFLFLVLTIVFLLSRQHKLRIHQQQLQLEQKLLRTQMNPHFIFNALAAIQQYLVRGDSQQASIYLGSFARLMRSVLKSSRQEWISLSEEIQMIETYLEIQKLRFNEHLLYTVELQKDIETDFIIVPPVLIQPFIENAIEHGISKRETPGTLKIEIKETDDILQFIIEDDGPGFKEVDNDSSHISYATAIFKERVHNLNLRLKKPITYRITHRQEVSELSEGVSVEINLPIVIKGKE